MATITIDVVSQVARAKLERLAGAIGPGPILKVVGQRLLSYVDQSFKTHGRGAWRPLAALTIAMRRQGSSEPLQDTGRYKQSFVAETDSKTFVEVGTNAKTPSGLSLAKIHEFGTGPFVIRVKNARSLAAQMRSGAWVHFGKEVHHPGIPARPVLPTQATAERLVVETVTEMIDMQIKGTA